MPSSKALCMWMVGRIATTAVPWQTLDLWCKMRGARPLELFRSKESNVFFWKGDSRFGFRASMDHHSARMLQGRGRLMLSLVFHTQGVVHVRT